MQPILEQLRAIGLVPVIKLNRPEQAVSLAKALERGGIPVAEVTFRAAGADRAIAAIAKECPDVLVGAGTVISVEQVKLAVDAGAKYIISPGFDQEVVSYCIGHGIPITPGCSNASEVGIATKMGLQAVKFFPAEAAGGLKALKALAGPFPQMRFIPTGGISPKNLSDYMAFPKVLACGGSWMVPEALLEVSDWEGIAALAREAVLCMLSPSLAHVGVNTDGDVAAKTAAGAFAALTGAPVKEGPVSYFTGSEFEWMCAPGRGRCGHLALRVSDVDRAERYYVSQGFAFDEATRKRDAQGLTTFLYMKDEIGGFGVHLIKQ